MVPRKDPVQDHGVATVDKLVDATIGILRADGHARLRVEDVLAATGLSFGTMYHHFGSRDGLIEAAVLVDFDRTNAALADAVDETLRDSGRDAAETLAAVLAGLLCDPVLVALQRHRMTLFGVVAHRPDVLDAMAVAEAELVAPLARFVADAQAAGTLRQDLVARAVAAFVFGCGFGRTTVELGDEGIDPQRWRGVVAAFARALTDRSGVAVEHAPAPAVDAPAATQQLAPSVPAPDAAQASTKERLIDAAITIMRERGEAGLRTRDVLDATGLSVATLYHHFGSRDGLIEAATIVEYRAVVADNIDAVRHAFVDATSCAQAEERLATVTRVVHDPARVPWKRRRLALVAAATHRPTLRAALAEVQDEVTASYAEALAQGRSSGLVRADVDPDALAVLGFAYAVGQTTASIGADPLPATHWIAVVDAVVHAVLAGGDRD